MSCQQVEDKIQPTEILENHEIDVEFEDNKNKQEMTEENDSSPVKGSCFGVSLGKLLKKNSKGLGSNSEKHENEKTKCLYFFGRREKTKRKSNTTCCQSQMNDNVNEATGSASFDGGERCGVKLEEKLVLCSDSSEESDNDFLPHLDRASRYSEGNVAPNVHMPFDSKVCEKRPRAYSTRHWQHLKSPMVDTRPLKVRRNAICDQIERDMLIQGPTLRQWRKIILTNYSLMDFDLRF